MVRVSCQEAKDGEGNGGQGGGIGKLAGKEVWWG